MSTGNGMVKALALTALLCLIAGCEQDRLSLPVTHAAGASLAKSDISASPAPGVLTQPAPSCYGFMLLRPKSQRAIAVQARLKEADQMAAALDSRTFAVDLMGDHANILSLQFPVVWPAPAAYTDQVSAVIDDYFAAPEVLDYLCNSGFEQVRLSARGVNDRRLHPLWMARVTPEGLIKPTVADN
jgi:hypothetical protein